MRILALDTALEACSVGVALPGGTAVSRLSVIGRGHAEILFGMIEEALGEARLTIGEIDRFAVTVGPGSFTGVRIGVAAARGFCLATGKKAAGITTLAANALSARDRVGSVAVCSLLPAKGAGVFGQFFDGKGKPTGSEESAAAEDFARRAREAAAVLAGAGAPMVQANDPSLTVVHDRSAPDIGAVLRLAAEAPEPTAAPRPLYMRPPDAAPMRPAIARR